MMEREVTDVAEGLSTDTRAAVRDLILVLADSKRLLGMRYAGWILGAPELEAGIACASMAQDEWGHGRLLYALLKEFDEDVDRIEHGREPAEYSNIEVLDQPPATWPDLVAINAFVDTALTVQFEAMANSSWQPIRQRVGKMLEEERFHEAHGYAWFRRLAASGSAGRAALSHATLSVLPIVVRWFGPDSARAASLRDKGVMDRSGNGLLLRFLDRIRPLLIEIDAFSGEPVSNASSPEFDEARRRITRRGPDARTIEQVRGDRNRVFLMD
ncbi:MAG: phenylacetate-CoA oxygenase subunit PaaI [Gemmatimonadetes bacterium]|nr:phenylacetate-CoA oxygenase subunit PaaI [Gemmatimonadota bacterium]